MSVSAIAFLVTVPIPVLAGLFWQWKVYSLYRLLGDRVGNLSYYWFAFQFQNPHFARQLGGYVDIYASLPDDLSDRVITARRQTRYAVSFAAVWGLLFLVLIGLGFKG
jgi:hypothetical protein